MELDLKKYISGREDLFTATNVVEMEEALTKFLEWHKTAINYTRCCKSDSELLSEHKCKFYVNADWSCLKCGCGKRIKPSEG